MRRVILAALILTTTGVAGGATWAAGARGPAPVAGPVWAEAAAAAPAGPAAVTARTSPAAPAATRPAPAALTRKKTTAPRRVEAAPRQRGNPPPFVQGFAAQPGVVRQRPRARPTAPVKVATTIDGCDRNYGTIAQCVPLTFPAGVTDKCAWLTGHGFTGLKIAGTDRQRLDPDRDGIACG